MLGLDTDIQITDYSIKIQLQLENKWKMRFILYFLLIFDILFILYGNTIIDFIDW
jgi:hypothetical protein